MKVSEIFCSIQGEGHFTGMASLFIRLSGCNLRCTWCDTPYSSWIPEGDEMDLIELVERSASLMDGLSIQHVVITGGEPFIYPELPWLVQAFKDRNYIVTLESAGTLFKETQADLISLSPKLSNSVPDADEFPNESKRHSALRLNPIVLSTFIQNSKNVQFKFVVEHFEQLQEVEDILVQLPPLAKENVYLMPQARDAKTLREASHKLVPWCLQRGYRLCTRLQVFLWGNTPGT